MDRPQDGHSRIFDNSCASLEVNRPIKKLKVFGIELPNEDHFFDFLNNPQEQDVLEHI